MVGWWFFWGRGRARYSGVFYEMRFVTVATATATAAAVVVVVGIGVGVGVGVVVAFVSRDRFEVGRWHFNRDYAQRFAEGGVCGEGAGVGSECDCRVESYTKNPRGACFSYFPRAVIASKGTKRCLFFFFVFSAPEMYCDSNSFPTAAPLLPLASYGFHTAVTGT